jgi:ElaB/YqjD/DUF883 family membrane-anchored ribosome-binding protein
MEYAKLNPAETNVYRAPEEITPEKIKDGARQVVRYADRRVQQNPWAAVGIGFGVGVLFGALVTLLALKN